MICARAKQRMISDFTLASTMPPYLSDGLKEYIITVLFHSIQQSHDFFALPKNLKKSDKSKKN